MKLPVQIAVALSGLLVTQTFAQEPVAPPPPAPVGTVAPAPGAPPPPPEPGGPEAPRPGPGPRGPRAEPPAPADNLPGASIENSVRQFLLNPDGEIDGLLLSDGTQVKFPPHLSTQVAKAIKTGDIVRVQGWKEADQAFTARTLQNVASGASVVDVPPAAPPAPPAPTGGRRPLESAGKVSTVLHSPKGEPDGAVLENGTVLRMPPHVAMQFAGMLQPGSALSVRGFGTENNIGRCIEVTEIGLQGQTPTAIYAAPAPAPRPRK